MSRKNRTNAATVSQSTQAEAALRQGTVDAAYVAPITDGVANTVLTDAVGSGMVSDAALNAAIGTDKTDGADTVPAGAPASNGHNFRATDDVAKKGPYASEAIARLPHNVYKNNGKVAWELYEVEMPGGLMFPEFGTSTVYTWACNADLALAFVARKMGFESGKAGAKTPVVGLKTKLTEAQDAAKKAEEENARLRAKLAEMGITL